MDKCFSCNKLILDKHIKLTTNNIVFIFCSTECLANKIEELKELRSH